MRRFHPAAAILLAGLAAGTFDIAGVIVFNAFRGITPAEIFRCIASALIGIRAAARGGDAVVALGVAIHFVLALFWTTIYYWLSRRFPVLLRHPLLCGPLYGAAIYPIMRVLVLPLTRMPPAAGVVTLARRADGVLVLMLGFGLAAALLLRRYAPVQARASGAGR